MNVLVPSLSNSGAGRSMDYSAYTHKVCSKCAQVLPVDMFKVEKKTSGVGWRYRAQCKPCSRPYSARYAAKRRRDRGVPEKIKSTPERRKAVQQKASRQHYNTHKEQERLRTKKWRRDNPEKQRFMEKRRKARVAGAVGSHTLAEWIKVKSEFGNMCVLCQKTDVKITQDHATALSMGGTDFIENILPLCTSCNSSKQAKKIDPLDVEYLRFR